MKKNLLFTFVISIFFAFAPILAMEKDQGPVVAPYFQNFDDVEAPALPPTWSRIVDNPTSTIATVATITAGPPISPPNNVRLFSNSNVDAIIMLITPELADIGENQIRFWARSNHATDRPNLVIGTMSSPTDTTSFTPWHTIQATNLANVYTEYTIPFSGYDGDHGYIAFRFDASPGLSSSRTIFIDDFHYEALPAIPVITVNPLTWDFGEVDVVETSAPKTFTISNSGLGQLHIESLTLDNEDDFVLDDQGNFPAVLSGSATATFQVAAAPDNTGALSGQVTISWHDGDEENTQTSTVNVSATGTARPAGSTCGNPFYISEFPLVDFEGSTEDMGDDYHITWVEPSTAYLSGNDMVFQFTLDETSYLSGSLATEQVWAGLVIVQQCPDLNNPAPVLHLAGTGGGSFVEFEDVVLHQGTYFAIVGSFPPPQFLDFTLNLSVVPVPPGPEFAITPAEESFDFGTAGAGVLPETQDYTITNTGGGILEVVSIEVSGDDDFTLNLDNFDFTDGFQGIALEEEFVFAVLFGPQTTGVKSAEVVISYNDDEGSHTHTISLTGEGVDVVVDVLPWIESFEEERFPPLGWSYVNGIEGAFWDRVDWNSVTGDYSARAYQGGASGYKADEWLISPPIQLGDLEGALLSFFGKSHNDHENSTLADMHIMILDQLYDNAEDLHENAELLSVERFSMNWEEYIFDLEEYSGQVYIAFNYLIDLSFQNFNWMFVDDVKVYVPAEVTFTIEDNSAFSPIEGAYVLLKNEEGYSATGITDADGIVTLSVDGFLDYTYTVRASGYHPMQGMISVGNEELFEDVMLDYRMLTPVSPMVTTEGLSAGEALFTWEDMPVSEFRIDDGTAASQLGSSGGTLNTVLGVAFRNDAELHEMSWYLTSEGGAHAQVKVWVFGLDANGQPNTDDVIFSAPGVPNVNNQWNSYVFPGVIEAPNGFLLGLSYQGYLGIATDSGTNEEWPFHPNTSFFAGNINTDPFVPIEQLGDFNRNILIRAKGYDFEAIDFDGNNKNYSLAFDIMPESRGVFAPVDAGRPYYQSSLADKIFVGYEVFLNDFTQPVAQVNERQFLFEELSEGQYSAGVRSVYTADTSSFVTIDFTVEDGFVPLYTLTLTADPQDGGTVSGEGEYEEGEEVIVFAAPNLHFGFIHWMVGEEVVSTEPEYTFTMPAADLHLTARFDPETFLGEISSTDITLFPNPASDMITLESNHAIQEVRVIDMQGLVIKTIAVSGENRLQVNLHEQKPGIYLLQIITDSHTYVKRVQLQK